MSGISRIMPVDFLFFFFSFIICFVFLVMLLFALLLFMVILVFAVVCIYGNCVATRNT